MLLNIPKPLFTDSYKASHFKLYPNVKEMIAYGEFRTSYNSDSEDNRILFYGIRFIIESYISKKWKIEDVENADKFFSTHMSGKKSYPFPKELFLKFIRENDGYFPVKIRALPEGTVIYPRVPVFIVEARDEYARLLTYLEGLLDMIWYPTTVATLSRRAKDIITKSFEKAVPKEDHVLINGRLHDFGFRGCTCAEQAVIGSSAHLINFDSTDTMCGAYYAQYMLNNGEPVGFSIPATEHSVMVSHETERDAVIKLIDNYGDDLYACVFDTYDYVNALESILPSISKIKKEKGGFLVIRPDSGDQVKAVLQALRAAENTFGAEKNSLGYKVLKGVGVIQGDGVSVETMKNILEEATNQGYSPSNVTFGMGGGLLQKLNRDTMSFATKLSQVTYSEEDTVRDVMKAPKNSSSKMSLPGKLSVKRDADGLPRVYPSEKVSPEDDLLSVVYDYGVVGSWDSYDTIRERAHREWVAAPKKCTVISHQLSDKIDIFLKAKVNK